MWFRNAVIVLSTVLLSSCGFQLRTSDVSHLDAVQVTGELSATSRAFRTALGEYGVESSPDAEVIIRIDDERSYRRPIATTANIDTAEYELRIEVDVTFTTRSKTVTATLVSERVYSVNRGNLSGSYEEQNTLLREMRTELSGLMIRRLEALNTAS